MSDREDCRLAIASLRQQVKAAAAVAGVLLAALRRNGPLDPALEALLAGGLVDAAAAQSEDVRQEWAAIVSATQRVATAATDSLGSEK